jgi:hypothetical protein
MNAQTDDHTATSLQIELANKTLGGWTMIEAAIAAVIASDSRASVGCAVALLYEGQPLEERMCLQWGTVLDSADENTAWFAERLAHLGLTLLASVSLRRLALCFSRSQLAIVLDHLPSHFAEKIAQEARTTAEELASRSGQPEARPVRTPAKTP